MAQLVEQLLPIPEVRGSNQVIGKNYIKHLLSTVLKRRKERKEAGTGRFKKALSVYRDLTGKLEACV